MDTFEDLSVLQTRFAANLNAAGMTDEAAFLANDLIIPGSLNPGLSGAYVLPGGTTQFRTYRFPFNVRDTWITGPAQTAVQWAQNNNAFFGWPTLQSRLADPNNVLTMVVMRTTTVRSSSNVDLDMVSPAAGLAFPSGKILVNNNFGAYVTPYCIWNQTGEGTEASEVTYLADGFISITIAE